MLSNIAGIVEECDPKVVKFETIDPLVCYSIAEYLGINIGPIERVRQLCDMNIQIHPPVLKARLERLRSQQFVDSEVSA